MGILRALPHLRSSMLRARIAQCHPPKGKKNKRRLALKKAGLLADKPEEAKRPDFTALSSAL